MKRLQFTVRALATLAFLAGAAMPAGAGSLLARGRYLVESIAGCGNCRTPQGPKGPILSKAKAGGLKIDEPGKFTVFTTNITQDRQTGIGSWTLDQIITALREGRRPDGSVVRPPMGYAYYARMSAVDLDALVAYFRSLKALPAR